MAGKPENDRLIRALFREAVDVTPIWIMRQAGRYLPEYRATRKKAGSFIKLCKTPELACEVTLQPINRYPLDAAILFSDILTVPDAMGLGLTVAEKQGPRFDKTIRNASDVKKLGIPDPETDLRYVMDAIRLIIDELDNRLPLIGFAGSPWTLSTYMVEGGTSKDFHIVKSLLYQEPKVMHALLSKLAEAVTLYLNAQIKAGAQVIMIFDSWGGILTGRAYLEFSLTYMKEIIQQLDTEHDDGNIPVILFSRGAGLWIESIADSGCDCIGLDWTQNIGSVRNKVGDRIALQGNLDPAVLYASPETIKHHVEQILENFGHGSGHVFNLGHGIQPGVDPEHAGVFIDAVHELSKKYHE